MERIVADNITSSYGAKIVLIGVNIVAGAGQCIGIVGKNGCGKSTLLNILTGLRKADSGDIYFDGKKAQGNAARELFMSYTGYVPQENNLIPELSVMDNLRLWYCDKNLLEQELTRGFLQDLGIDEMCQTKVGKLSGGMKKRVSIGCALAGHPPILILDEPDAALDLPGKADIRRYLDMYRRSGGTVIMATHDESGLALCDRVFVLTGGISREIDSSLRGDSLLYEINGGK